MDLDAMVSELLADHESLGAAVGWVDAGERTIATAGTRGADRGPVEHDTIFAAASLTKPVFAAGVMALVDDGVLELDRPLSEYLSEPYLTEDDRVASITSRMVLSHTTGFPNWREGSDDRVHPSHGALRLRWPPGTRWGYSGEGFSYLQEVVEQLCAAPIAEYLADVVLRPLGMIDSSFAWPDADEPRLAIGHDESGAARPLFRPPKAKAAAGGMFTTAPDYLRFLDHCLVYEQRMFVQHAHIDEELAWGLGWGIENGEANAVWQWGDDPGYKNFVIGRPTQEVGLVVFTNGDRGADVYTALVRKLLPGPHPSLEAWHRPAWLRGWQAS
jgi:CubicO group peptidase (beta-lactamase class C family)